MTLNLNHDAVQKAVQHAYLPGLRYAADLIQTAMTEMEAPTFGGQDKKPIPLRAVRKAGASRRRAEKKRAQPVPAVKMVKKKRRKPYYSPERKREIVALAAEVGRKQAHRQTGAAVSAITRWKKEMA